MNELLCKTQDSGLDDVFYIVLPQKPLKTNEGCYGYFSMSCRHHPVEAHALKGGGHHLRV